MTPLNTSIVLFDLDGTLIDSAADFIHVLHEMRRADGLPILPEDRIRNTVSNGSKALIQLAYGSEIPDSHALEQKRQELLERYLVCAGDRASLFDGMDDVLRQLEQRDTPWGIVTNKPTRFTDVLLHKLNLVNRCAISICPDDVKKTKPDPEGLLLACARTSAQPDRAWYVGDHARDIEAGKAAGMRTIAARYGYIDDLNEIADWQADYIIDTPSELTVILGL